jgi:hypothetical protein
MGEWSQEADDVSVILRALFEINAKLADVGEHVVAIRSLLEEDGEEEEDLPEP